MNTTIKIRLKPTQEQEDILWQLAGTSRFIYNWILTRQKEKQESEHKSKQEPKQDPKHELEQHSTNGKFIKMLKLNELKNEFANLRQQEEYSWLNKINNDICKMSIRQSYNRINYFYKNNRYLPKFILKNKSIPKFYCNHNNIQFCNNRLYIDGIGWLKVSEGERIKADKFTFAQISFDSKYWYVILADNNIKNIIPNTDYNHQAINYSFIQQYDLPISNFDIVQIKKLKKLKNRISKKYIKNQDNRFHKTKNIKKLEDKVKLVNRKIYNIKTNNLHNMLSSIMKTRPSKIVIGELNKNCYIEPYLKSDSQQMNHIKAILQNKCKKYGVQLDTDDYLHPSKIQCYYL